MASGSFAVTTSNQYIAGTVSWQSTKNISANTSTVTATLRLSRTNTGYETYGYGEFNLWINGDSNTNTGYFSLTYQSNTVLVTHTVTVPHDADGKKSISIAVSGYILAGSPDLTLSAQSAAAVLDTIPRASSLSLDHTQLDAGETITLTITPYVNTYSHEVTWKLGSMTKTQTLAAGSLSAALTVPLSWLSELPNAASKVAAVTVVTQNGSTQVGSSSKSFTVCAPASAVPSVAAFTATRVDGAVPSAWGEYVKGYSKAQLDVTGAEGIYGSSIASVRITGAGFAFEGSSAQTEFLPVSGEVVFTATVTDTRGRSARKTAAITVRDYAAPSVFDVAAVRCTQDGTASKTGTYVKASAAFTFSSVGGKNTAQATLYTRATGESAWTSRGTISSQTPVLLSGFSLVSTYELKVTAADALSESTATAGISVGKAILSLKANGSGAAFGKYAQSDNLLDVEWDLRVRGETELDTPLPLSSGGTGESTASGAVSNLGITDYIVEQGVSGIWTYRKWNSGILELWGEKAYQDYAITSASGNGYYALSGSIPFPFSFSATPKVFLTVGGNRGLKSIAPTAITSSEISNAFIFCTMSGTFATSISIFAIGLWK